ncbi:MAG: DUF6129 family protein [Zoogloeaceae bacterium]|jgi:hypothetical protein|nr:DUF6129 family protein [Zoogloeaceae bacterium]
MNISPEFLQTVAASVASVRGGKTAQALREEFPGVMFTDCGEDDVPARMRPVLETPAHFYFLFTNASGHCLEFTSEFDAATGIVVATRADED